MVASSLFHHEARQNRATPFDLLVEEGLVRCELAEDGAAMVNADDLMLQVEGLVSEVHDAGEQPQAPL